MKESQDKKGTCALFGGKAQRKSRATALTLIHTLLARHKQTEKIKSIIILSFFFCHPSTFTHSQSQIAPVLSSLSVCHPTSALNPPVQWTQQVECKHEHEQSLAGASTPLTSDAAFVVLQSFFFFFCTDTNSACDPCSNGRAPSRGPHQPSSSLSNLTFL